MKLNRLFIVTFLIFSMGVAANAHAQETVTETATTAPLPVVDKGPEDALNRGTPRGSIVGFLDACSTFDFEKAAEYLDLRNLSDEASEISGPELARQLNHVLSRSVWLDDYSVSDNPEGVKGDGLPDYRDELVVIPDLHGKQVPLWLQHVPRGDGEKIWKLSNRSVNLIPDLYDQFSYSPIVEKIRNWFPQDASFLGFEAFKWFILITGGLLTWPFLYLFGRLLTFVITSPGKENYSLIRQALTGPLVALGLLIIGGLFLDELGAGVYAQQVMETKTLGTVVMIWALWSLVNLYRQRKQEKLTALGRPGAAKLMRPMTLFLKIVVLIFGALFWMHNMGINITTVMAGLGVGGLAIALALQKPIEDMMGAFTIFSQATIKVGDYCKYGGFSGIVEDIGLRSVKMRTLTNTLVLIPNSRIAYVEVENISAREKIRFWPTLRLRYDTTPEQLRNIMDGILEVLQENEQVYAEPMRVRLTDFDEDAILIKIHSFLKTTDYPESLKIGEGINFQIMDIIHTAGAQFALPAKSVYLEGQSANHKA